jgi:ABC-2 type transport system ATP-binding protein
LLILDESTSGLDPVARCAFLKVLVGDVAAEGRTVFFSTHLLSDIEAVADTVGIIKDGRLLVSGELDEMREAHRVFRIVYAEMPPEEEVRSLRTLPDVRKVEREGRGIKLGVRGDCRERLAGPSPSRRRRGLNGHDPRRHLRCVRGGGR